jgi:hypothetical protein
MPRAINHRDVALLARMARAIRRRRTELGLATAFTLTQALLVHTLGFNPGTDLVLLVSVIAWLTPATRERITAALVGSARARRWEDALGAVMPTNPARVGTVERGAFGESAWVRLGAGWSPTHLEARAEILASFLDVAAVRIRRHPTHTGWVCVRAMVTDPLARPTPPWPWVGSARTDLWKPVPLGLDEDGAQVKITLVGHNLLLGGEPGAGKSGALSLLVAAAALDPSVSLWLMDGKLVELAAWKESAAGFAGIDITEAIALVRRLQAVIDERFAELLASGARKVEPGTGLHVVVCDELAHYLTWPERKARDAFTDAFRDLVSRGRAAGVIVLAATQKPGSDVVPTSIRDLFGYRLAMRCATAAASDTVLGSGWATAGYSAAAIDPATRGVGLLLHESGIPVRLRTHWADDATVADLARRAEELRGGA